MKKMGKFPEFGRDHVARGSSGPQAAACPDIGTVLGRWRVFPQCPHSLHAGLNASARKHHLFYHFREGK